MDLGSKERAFTDTKERLRQPLHWYPWPCLLVFVIILLFTGHVVFGTTERLGHPVKLLDFAAPSDNPGGIWVSVSPQEDDVVVTTTDRSVFRWPLKAADPHAGRELAKYLDHQVREKFAAAALSAETYRSQAKVVIAADERLKYRHVKPVLYALAKAKIHRYAFETRLPADGKPPLDASAL